MASTPDFVPYIADQNESQKPNTMPNPTNKQELVAAMTDLQVPTGRR